MNLNFRFPKLKPVQIVVISFILIIVVGSLLLNLPVSNKVAGARYIDHLFTAISSVCVTGLVVLYPVHQYTLFGQMVMLGLIQCGGLGLTTIIAYVLHQFKIKIDIRSAKAVSEATGYSNLSTLKDYILRIVKYTLIFEAMGILLLSIRFIPAFGFWPGMFKAVFLSVSAFCNAGFDNIGLVSLIPYASDLLVNLTVTGLIIVGGLGFPVWIELIRLTRGLIRKKTNFFKTVRSISSHTRIVLRVTFFLLIGGTVLIFLFDVSNDGSLGSLSFGKGLMIAFFQSVSLRTAGFSTVDTAALSSPSILLMIGLMMIGGSPSGTAGGIKTTTVYLVYRFIKQEYKEENSIIIHNREIGRPLITKAIVIFITFIAIYLFASLLLVLLLPEVDPLRVFFEAASAIGTVGLTMNLTILLNDYAKIIVMLLMFFGRVGPLSIIFAVHRSDHKKNIEIHYPHADVLIG